MVLVREQTIFIVILKKFYDNIFFPYLEKNILIPLFIWEICLDSRKSIDYQSLEWSKRVVFEPLKKYKVHAITGNHDAYYKNLIKLTHQNFY